MVSVVMPVFNGEKFLKIAIESILNQTYTDFELIIISDGSTDRSVEIIKSYQDNRVRFLENEENKGIFYTRNRLLEEAKGKYVAILDCDDYAETTRLEKQVRFLDKNEEFGLVGSWVTLIDRENRIKEVWNLEHRPERIPSKLLFLNQFAQSSVMIRKEFAELKYREEIPLAEDYDLWVRISQKTRVINLAEFLVKYRLHQENISQIKVIELQKNVFKIYKYQLEKLGIYANQDELIIHEKIGNMNFETTASFFEKAKSWLELLHSKNEEIEVYNKLVFNELLGEYWAELLSKTLHLPSSKKAFYHCSLSSFINPHKKSNLSKSFILRSFPFNYTLKPVLNIVNHLKHWKESEERD